MICTHPVGMSRDFHPRRPKHTGAMAMQKYTETTHKQNFLHANAMQSLSKKWLEPKWHACTRRSRLSCAASRWNPPRPWDNETSMWSATRGWRTRIMGSVSAQLDQYAVVRRRSAFLKFSPPDPNGKLAIAHTASVTGMFNRFCKHWRIPASPWGANWKLFQEWTTRRT